MPHTGSNRSDPGTPSDAIAIAIAIAIVGTVSTERGVTKSSRIYTHHANEILAGGVAWYAANGELQPGSTIVSVGHVNFGNPIVHVQHT